MKRFKKILKWTCVTTGLLIILIMIIYLVVYINTESRINRKYSYDIPKLDIPTDAAAIAQGAHLYHIRGCEDCHGKNLTGKIFMNDPMVLQITVPNLTRGVGGLPSNFTDQDWIRVLRHGIDKNGKPLWIMPAHESSQMTKEDMAKVIAYCKSMVPMESTLPKLHSIGPIGRLLIVLDQAVVLPVEKVNHSVALVQNQKQEITADYGKYLSVGCQGCHRANLEGGGPLAPGFPDVPNITGAGDPGKWNESLFIRTIRRGITPEGRKLRDEFMPWKSFSHFTDDELKAIYKYLKTLPK